MEPEDREAMREDLTMLGAINVCRNRVFQSLVDKRQAFCRTPEGASALEDLHAFRTLDELVRIDPD
jgi:hypothetical protein